MKYTNAYFQLNIKTDGVYLHLYPALDNGKPIVLQELIDYLDGCGINDYDLKALNNAVVNNTKESEILISKTPIREVGEKASVKISDDKMLAIIRFYLSAPRSKRAHDLVDLQIIMAKAAIDMRKTAQICQRLFAYRKTHAWPPQIAKDANWDEAYSAQKLNLPVLTTVDEAIAWANDLIREIDAAGR